MSQSDDHGRSESQPSGPGGGPQYGRPEHGQGQYGDPAYTQQFTTPVSYGQQPYPQQYGQQYGQPAGFQQPYGAYGTSAAPAKPGGVITAAVLGFVFGAFGALISLFLIIAGATATTVGDDLEQEVPGFGSMAGAVGGALLVVGLLALAWTVVMIWGSVWALTGRSRVLLLVGGSVAVAIALLGMLGSLAGSGAAELVGNLLFLLAAAAIVVLLSTKSAAHYFAAHRYRRTGH
ncbi:hypothetical protein [Blastococcus saxobsidens]|uniref:Uncharacterized protein n=1 Tax=Blastococcus saxobsidens (strain DD2) TaxID=1146883 RepID=H6RWQ7_BLASD|nr:hypothetical protein [Blastococcus saxobsidens]CCG04678.1 conserved membrane protein of unknown function [Blastococcus saxobsidens DD2]